MKIATFLVALAAVSACGHAAQAQSFRPVPAVTTPIPLGDDNDVAATLPFAVKVGTEAPWTGARISQNGGIYKADLSDRLPIYFDDLDARVDTGQANFGSSTVNGRPAFIVTHAGVGYCCGGPTRANVQLVIIDRSDIAPGDFDLEINTQGLDRPPIAFYFLADFANAGTAGTGAFPAGPQALRASWTFRNGVLTSGTGPTVVAVATVPTLTEWAMIVFGLLLAGGAVLQLQRRRSVV